MQQRKLLNVHIIYLAMPNAVLLSFIELHLSTGDNKNLL